MKKYIIASIVVLSSINLESQIQSSIEFKILNLRSEINSREETFFNFQLSNNSNKTFLVPNIISFNNISNKNPNLDIGYEVYREAAGNSFILLDSCFILDNPLIPEEGIINYKYPKGSIFLHESQLPLYCMYQKGRYKIRFNFFLKEDNGRKIRINSKWYYFKVNRDLL